MFSITFFFPPLQCKLWAWMLFPGELLMQRGLDPMIPASLSSQLSLRSQWDGLWVRFLPWVEGWSQSGHEVLLLKANHFLIWAQESPGGSKVGLISSESWMILLKVGWEGIPITECEPCIRPYPESLACAISPNRNRTWLITVFKSSYCHLRQLRWEDVCARVTPCLIQEPLTLTLGWLSVRDALFTSSAII